LFCLHFHIQFLALPRESRVARGAAEIPLQVGGWLMINGVERLKFRGCWSVPSARSYDGTAWLSLKVITRMAFGIFQSLHQERETCFQNISNRLSIRSHLFNSYVDHSIHEKGSYHQYLAESRRE
jgi:hypothetical protein